MQAPLRNVLFLCSDNAAVSIIAEAILHSVGRGRFRAYSAGWQPALGVKPAVLHFLEQRELATVGLRAKSWLELAPPQGPVFDYIITLSPGPMDDDADLFSQWPGDPVVAHWNVPQLGFAFDDSRKAEYAIRDLFWVLMRRIKIFANLPHGKVKRHLLQHRLVALQNWQ